MVPRERVAQVDSEKPKDMFEISKIRNGTSFPNHTPPVPKNNFIHLLNPNDWAFLSYLAVVGAIIVTFHANLSNWPAFLAVQITVVAGILWLVYAYHRAPSPTLGIIRHWYPILFFTFLYMQAGLFNQLVFQGYADNFFSDLDQWIFGVNPNIWLYERLNNFYFNELIHLCYFSYYVLPVVLGVILYIAKDREFYRTLFGISITFYFCYLLYILLPVAGPVDQRQGRFTDGGPFVQIMDWIYMEAEKPGAAFPSSHVAIALITLMYAFRLHRTAFWIFLPFIAGLVFSTFYGFYHYVVDAIAGAVVAVGSYYLCNYLFDKYAKAKFPNHFP